MIQIKRNNKVFFTLEDFGEGSKLSYQLMDHHYIILKFTTATPVYFEIGDSVEIPDFGYFELTSAYFPKHNDSDGYDYEMQMDAYYMSWKNKLCKYRPQHGANETSFKLTTTVGVHMNVILGNLKALGLTYNGKEFSVDYTTYNNKAFDVQKRFLIEYGSISILDALNAICSEDALNCEWWIDGSIIYLGYCEMEGQTIFEQDVNVLSMSYSESKSTYITRLYAFGSDRNIPKGYFTGADADVTTDGVATDYLMLPNKEVDSDGFYAKDGYLENVNVVKNDKQAIEGVVMFEEEYPKVESVVSSIKTYDSTVDNEDGTKTTQTFWQVTATDSFATNFEASWIKSNLTLGIKFTSGALMGMEFDVSFKVIDKVNYFEIVANDTYGRTLPDGVMCPKVGDKYFLFNWDATKITDTDLIPTAQLSLFDRAKQYYQKTMISNSNFTCTMDGDKFYNDGIYDYHPLGEQVKLINNMFAQVDADGKHYRNSRIIGMEIPLDIPYDHPQYIVGEKAATSRLGKLEDKVDSIKVNGMQIGGTGSGNGGGVYVIGMNDTTPASDSNVYSARRSRMEFIHRLTDDTAKGTVTWEKVQKFMQGLAIGESGKHYIDKNGGASLSDVVVDRIHDAASTPSDRVIIGAQGFDLYMGDDGKSHMYLDNIVVRQKFFASSAEIRKISYSGGTTIFSNAGSTLAKVSVIFDADGNCIGYKCYACADDGTTRTMNWWRIGMMALCQTFNVKAGKNEKLQNRYYWRLVVGVGQEILDDGKLYDYVVLSNKEKFLGSESIVPTYANKLVTADGANMLVFGDYGIEVSDAESMGSMAGILMELEDKETDEGGNLIANRYFYGYESGIAQDAPAEGDVIVQVGDQICWKSRGNLIKISTSTEDNATDNAPAITMYHNLGALYSTGKKDSAGMEIISPYQWKTCTCVISPEQVKFNANNFMWFTEDPEKPFSPITVFYNIETNGMFRVGSSGRLYGDNVENGTAKVAVCCYKVMGDTKDVLDKCWWESSCQDIKIDSPYTGRTDLQTNDAAAQNLPAYFTLDCYTLSVTADGTKHRGDVLLATMDIPVLKDGDKGEKGDQGEKGDPGVAGVSPVTYTVDFLLQEKKVYIYVHKIQEKTNITHLISKWNDTLTCNVYINGEYLAYKDSDVMSDGYIDLLAFPSAKTIDIILKQKDGDEQLAIGNYTIGSEFEYQIIPEVVIFDTNDEGKLLIPKQSAEIKCYRNGQDVTNNCGFSLTNNHHLNCTPGPGQKKNMVIIQNITNVTVDGITMPAQNGYAQVQITDEHGGLHYAYVKFQVNITKFVAHVYSNNKTLTSQYSEMSGKVNDMSGKLDGLPTGNELKEWKSSIIQTAREISLSVSEKSIGRRNMLVGSAFRKYGDGFIYMSGTESQYYDGYPLEQIEKNSGIDGVNCIHCRTKQTGTDRYYLSGFRWHGISPQGNIKLEKGKNYVLSFYAKTHTPNDIYFTAEVLYQGSKIDTSRPAGYSGPIGYITTFAASEADKWELFTVKVSVPSNAPYEYVEINIFARGRSYSFVGGYICKPMLEEGENYNGWTLSEQDYDYVGGNLLDNARTLDKSGTLIATNDTVIQNGYGTDSACIENLMQANATLSDYKEVLRWSFGSTYLVNGNDYIFSFVAKADVDDARVVCYMWSGDINISSDIFTEGNGGAWDSLVDGNIVFILSRQWTRYWVHWKPNDGYATPKEVIIRHTGNNSTSASTVYVTQPKLEIGATMTEWTERKSDLVDKASLKAAGIVVDSESVTLYGNQVHIKKNKTDTNDTVLIDNETGQVSAGLINAYEVVAKGIKTQELEAQNLNVTGNSRLGIFEIKTSSIDERDQYSIAGDMITYRGRYKLPDGKTDIISVDGLAYLMYKPLFIRQGAPENGRYMRLGNSYTEWDDCGTGNGDSYLFNGASARYVCSGSSNCTYYALPKNLTYNTGYSPVSYIYATKATQNDPAFAINVVKTKDSSDGTRTAIQTNGAIRGVIAPNLRIMNYSGQISSSDCIVIVTTNNIKLILPPGPVAGQTLLIFTRGTSNIEVDYNSTSGEKMYSSGEQTKIKIGGSGVLTYFIFDGKYWCYAYFNGSHRNA